MASAAETELQAACRATWAAYTKAYQERYGTDPVRNLTVNAQVKQFVQRLDGAEAPAVAAFFVEQVTDAYILRLCHSVGALLSHAESYRTRWKTNRASPPVQAVSANINKHAAAARAIWGDPATQSREIIDV